MQLLEGTSLAPLRDMPPLFRTGLTLLIATGAACAPPRPLTGPWAAGLPAAPAGMSPEAWTHAHAAYAQVGREGLRPRRLLTIIDYSLPSTARRLWVMDPGTNQVLGNEYVAHGWGSGGTWATDFSNRAGSYQSSLGTFITGDSYVGVRGLSLRLRGIEPGINDRAWARGIVMHGSPNVSAARATIGRVGRTEGCPAVPQESARRLVNLLEGGSVVFAWFPDPNFLARSEYLDRTLVPFTLAP